MEEAGDGDKVVDREEDVNRDEVRKMEERRLKETQV